MIEGTNFAPLAIRKELRMDTNRLTRGLMLLATATLLAISANAQTTEQNVNVTIRPSQTVEQRVADELKAKELLRAAAEKAAAEKAAAEKAAAEKAAAEEAARIAEQNPK